VQSNRLVANPLTDHHTPKCKQNFAQCVCVCARACVNRQVSPRDLCPKIGGLIFYPRGNLFKAIIRNYPHVKDYCLLRMVNGSQFRVAPQLLVLGASSELPALGL
jgi:hypothetical protein